MAALSRHRFQIQYTLTINRRVDANETVLEPELVGQSDAQRLAHTDIHQTSAFNGMHAFVPFIN